MDTTWILVAHRDGAQLFERRDRDLSLLQEIAHDEGEPRKLERETDGPRRSALVEDGQKATERETLRFIQQLAGVLEDGRVRKRYGTLVLVAEPRVLGELRAAVTPETEALISATQRMDMVAMETPAIKKYLQNFVWPSSRTRRH